MDPIQIALTGVLAPAVLAAAVIILAALVTKKREARIQDLSAPRWAGVALAAAFGLGFALTLEWPALPPVDVTQIGPWAAVFAAPLAFLPGLWRALATGLLGLGLGVFLASPAYTGGELVGHIAFVTATVVAIERGLSLIPEGRVQTLVALLFVSGAAAVVLLSDVASLAVTTGALAAGLGALFTASLVAPGLATIGRAAPVIALVSAAHLFGAALYANGSYAPIAILAVSPLIVAGVFRFVSSTTRAALVPLGVAVLTVGGATALAATRYFAAHDAPAADEATDASDDYGY